MSPATRIFQPVPDRIETASRLAVKTRYATDWLKQQQKEHLIFPTDSCTILPYRDKREAHATFVLDLERLLKFSHLDASVKLVYNNGLALDDIMAPPEEEKIMHHDKTRSNWRMRCLQRCHPGVGTAT